MRVELLCCRKTFSWLGHDHVIEGSHWTQWRQFIFRATYFSIDDKKTNKNQVKKNKVLRQMLCNPQVFFSRYSFFCHTSWQQHKEPRARLVLKPNFISICNLALSMYLLCVVCIFTKQQLYFFWSSKLKKKLNRFLGLTVSQATPETVL